MTGIVPPDRGADPRRGGAVRRAVDDLRASRRDVPNSRPTPPWLRRFAWLLDDAFPVPGLPGRRVGVDGLLAIVPVAGDLAGIVLAMVVVVAGIAAGVSIPTIVRMLLNIGIEALVGLLPILGTVFNMAWKANNKNVALIEADLADRRRTRRSSLRVVILVVVALVVAAFMMLAAAVAGVLVLIWLVSQLF